MSLATICSIGFGLAIAGCGDDDGADETATVAKATVIEKGDAICRRADLERSDLDVPADGDPLKAKRGDLRQWGTFVADESRVLRESIDSIEKIGKPDEDADVLARAIANGNQVVDFVAAAGRSATDGDLAGYRRGLERGFDAATRAARAAHEFGFRICG